MSDFKNYRRTQITEMRIVTKEDVINFKRNGYIKDDVTIFKDNGHFKDRGLCSVSISDADINKGSPKIGDMIARNPKDHNDQWLVAKKYFKDNFIDV